MNVLAMFENVQRKIKDVRALRRYVCPAIRLRIYLPAEDTTSEPLKDALVKTVKHPSFETLKNLTIRRFIT